LATVLIPDPICLTQTAALRGLGRRGDVCDVAWSRSNWRLKLHEKFYSKFCRRIITIPSLYDDPKAFAEAIVELCGTGTYDAVLPMQGNSLEALIPYAQQLAACTGTLMPTQTQYAVGYDKMNTVNTCRELGIIHPDSVFLSEDNCFEEVASTFGYPIVIKHRQNFGGSVGVRVVAERANLKSAVQQLLRYTNKIEDLMIQKFLPGTLFDVCVVAREGNLSGLVMQARRLMYPISGGAACILVTVDSPQLADIASSIVRALKWTGPAQLEFKWDPELATFSLIEINPRFWGTTGAWLRAGINFPALAVDLAMGCEVNDFPKLPPNLRFKYLVVRTPLAIVQLCRAKGFSALHDPMSYTRTWYDFDATDPLPDIWHLLKEVMSTIKGNRSLIDKSLPADLIPSFEE